MIVGITGVYCSGKSTVAEMLKDYGFITIDADQIGHRVLDRLKSRIIRQFGKSVLTKNKVDRRKLAAVVFKDIEKLKKLNAVVHPAIIDEIKKIIRDNPDADLALDASLLLESGAYSLVDKIIVVTVSRTKLMKRAKKRPHSADELEIIFSSQFSQKEKLKYADAAIDNSGDLEETKNQLRLILAKWQK